MWTERKCATEARVETRDREKRGCVCVWRGGRGGERRGGGGGGGGKKAEKDLPVCQKSGLGGLAGSHGAG